MKITVLTLFPEMFDSPLKYSIIKRAIDRKLLRINFINIRDFGIGPHKMVDDRPYGGGVGMVMRVDVIDRAISNINPAKAGQMSNLKTKTPRMVCECTPPRWKEKVILLDPKGKLFNQQMARRFSKLDHLILVCGHYEGVDERVRKLVDETISIGDYILTGGEIPAMVIVDTVTRLIPGVLSKKEAVLVESFHRPSSIIHHLSLEFPQYTRPEVYNKMQVPSVLLSGNHKKIEAWRKEQAIKLTQKLRPDLLI